MTNTYGCEKHIKPKNRRQGRAQPRMGLQRTRLILLVGEIGFKPPITGNFMRILRDFASC